MPLISPTVRITSSASITCETTCSNIQGAASYSADIAFAIVDEVDSILIDEARTPLIISGAGAKSTDLYDKADKFVRTLQEVRHQGA